MLIKHNDFDNNNHNYCIHNNSINNNSENNMIPKMVDPPNQP